MNQEKKDGMVLLIEHKWKIIAAIAVALFFLAIIFILRPLADGIILGLVFAYISRPIYLKLNKNKRVGALVATICIVIPIIFILGMGILEIIQQITWIVQNQNEVISSLTGFINNVEIPDFLHTGIEQSIQDISQSIIPILREIGIVSYAKDLVIFLLNLVISIIVCYFLLSDGNTLYQKVLDITPSNYQKTFQNYVTELDKILGGIFIGNAYAALFVSIMSAIVFYVFGFSHILALSALIFIAAVVPLFAGYMVLLPLALLRYFNQGIEAALIFFLVASIVIYLPPELFMRPYLASLKSKVHPLLIMLAFIGGAFVGGIAGFFAAPILLGALIAAYRVYVSELRSYGYNLGQNTDKSENNG
ncbi:protein of unknown function UPF0118 [Methanohalobium evestigatum Z-7303]|uniref:AI-2E family transporter n=1 Tax=Methanohalobium evestigatum (strain ATCC BAA-1072 / DSM 3721 / NBRC 107634 / OCM 161 / Z-7303) TaxID=644295 RepID=D7E860_METEZ|nr:AI-2E family transporter [Methanohalobium evestigatum]ADI73402.1 protein of unknown function UPF0118 [Methanohalobium evestigatum Z-7303]